MKYPSRAFFAHLLCILSFTALHAQQVCTDGGCCREPSACTAQTPIDFRTLRPDTESNPFSIVFQRQAFKSYFDSKKCNVYLTPKTGTASLIRFRGAVYTLKEIHAHVPNEHKLRGFPENPAGNNFEIHLVFSCPRPAPGADPIIVIGLLGTFQAKANPGSFTYEACAGIALGAEAAGKKPPADTAEVTLNLGELADPQNSHALAFSFYTYHGSLTTGVCDETVTWIVSQEITYHARPFSEHVRKYIRGARLPQHLNNREVYEVKH